jgi:hypothetical protein
MTPALRKALFGDSGRGGGRDGGWSGRGKKSKDETPLSIADFEGVEVEALSPAKQEVSVLGMAVMLG